MAKQLADKAMLMEANLAVELGAITNVQYRHTNTVYVLYFCCGSSQVKSMLMKADVSRDSEELGKVVEIFYGLVRARRGL